MSDTRREARDTRREARGARRETRGARFDAAIDGAVREMLDVDPPAGLRGRVLDRIGSTTHVASTFRWKTSTHHVASTFRWKTSTHHVASTFRWKAWWILAPIAAAAVIVLAVLIPRQRTAPPAVTPGAPSIARLEPPPVVAPVPSPQTPGSPTTASTAPSQVTASASPRPASGGQDDRSVIATVAADADTDVNPSTAIDPLLPIPPITVAGVRPVDITPKEIAIAPLTAITELQIAPLSPPERRN